jgi:hypothetical protein
VARSGGWMARFGTSQNPRMPNQLLWVAEVANAYQSTFPNRLRTENMTRIGCSYPNNIYVGSDSSAALTVVQFRHKWLSLS